MDASTSAFRVQLRYDVRLTKRWLLFYLSKLLPATAILILLFLLFSEAFLTLWRFRLVSIGGRVHPLLVLSFCDTIVDLFHPLWHKTASS